MVVVQQPGEICQALLAEKPEGHADVEMTPPVSCIMHKAISSTFFVEVPWPRVVSLHALFDDPLTVEVPRTSDPKPKQLEVCDGLQDVVTTTCSGYKINWSRVKHTHVLQLGVIAPCVHGIGNIYYKLARHKRLYALHAAWEYSSPFWCRWSGTRQTDHCHLSSLDLKRHLSGLSCRHGRNAIGEHLVVPLVATGSVEIDSLVCSTRASVVAGVGFEVHLAGAAACAKEMAVGV